MHATRTVISKPRFVVIQISPPFFPPLSRASLTRSLTSHIASFSSPRYLSLHLFPRSGSESFWEGKMLGRPANAADR